MALTPEVFRCIAIAKALEFYDRTGIKLNTAYTPANMLNAVAQITGRKFRRNQLTEAAEHLRAFAQTRHMESVQ